MVEHFFEALTTHGGITLHINVPYGNNPHHILEAVFKAFGKALEGASRINARIKGIPSTKGKL
jgi:imidazoleglycerol-phosphate dehydratase